jgi:plastocyanin
MVAELLVALAFTAGPADRPVKVARWSTPVCRKARRCRKHRLRGPLYRPPGLPPVVPAPGAPAPALPSRTSVDLTDDDDMGWRVTPAYRTLRAGEVEFNATNLGMDDHDFSVRRGGATLASVPLLPGQSEAVRLTLPVGGYTLFCSLPTHEQLGMKAEITVR